MSINIVSSPDSNVIFQSSDGILFKVHKVNLTIGARGFAPPEFETQGEIVHLSESANTLEVLFQFCYPTPYPYLGGMEFDVLALLAEAAEKYQIFSAMNICKIYMK